MLLSDSHFPSSRINIMLIIYTAVFRLQKEILHLEFERKEPDDNGLINEKCFAELLLTYADYSPKKKAIIIKRVKKTFKVIL